MTQTVISRTSGALETIALSFITQSEWGAFLKLATGNRRLAAIVAADVVGYSRLVAADEEGTLAALAAHRVELIEGKIADYRGRIANTAGDSLLVEFPSVVDALRCAIDMQKGMEYRNAEVPEDRQILFRIGINLGDVVAQDGDLLGDGVNVAARLEGLAEPGGICLSSAAHDQVKGRVAVSFKDLGSKSLKNIPEAVRVFAVISSNSGGRSPGRLKRQPGYAMIVLAALIVLVAGIGSWWVWTLDGGFETGSTAPPSADADERPVLAVLPFTNLSPDEDQRYFSDGITTDLITDLSKVSGLQVIARNSSFAYRQRQDNIRVIGQELGATHVLTGSVRKAVGKVRISAELVETASSRNLWAERYDRDLSGIFAIQDEVTEKIVGAMEVTLTDTERAILHRPYTDSVEAYDLYLKGRQEHLRFNHSGNDAAKRFFQSAIDLDPDFADAHAFLAWSYARDLIFRWSDNPTAGLARALEAARKAVSLDETKALGYMALGMVELYQGRHTEAVSTLEKAVTLNPKHADSLAMLAYILNFTGLPDKAEPVIIKAMRLYPRHTYMYTMVHGQSRFLAQHYEQAASLFMEAATRNPEDTQIQLWLAASLAQVGRLEDAQWQVSELLVNNPKYTLRAIDELLPFKNPDHRTRIIDSLRSVGMPE